MENRLQADRSSHSNEIFIIAALLTFLGLLAIYSSSSIVASQKMGDALHYLKKQSAVAMVGFAFFLALQLIPFKWIERATLPSVAAALLLLILTLIPEFHHRVKGAARWVALGPFSFQPAELTKLALVLYMAKSLNRPDANVRRFKGILAQIWVPALLAIPLMIQPDFGTTFILLFLTYLMLYTAGLPFKYSLGLGAAGIVTMGLAILYAPYRMARLTAFLHPWENIQTGGFQIIQSYLAFQNGGFLGLGAGASRQRLYFLPEAHTDFILSVIGEEFGLIGVIFVILCFALLLRAGVGVALQQKRKYRRHLAFGITGFIVVQASLNMGVVLGLLPTKGISLPFVSSGASSLLIFLIMAGLLSRLGRGDIYNNGHS